MINNSIPYEISIWRMEDRYIIELNGVVSTVSSLANFNANTDTLINLYTEEVKICTIASNEYTSMIYAFNIHFKQNVNGTNTLTFSIVLNYTDESTLELKQNPFIGYLVSNSHIKLKYDYVYNSNGTICKDTNNNPIYEWYDLIVQSINESLEDNVFIYECNDAHINELSKNGYNIELDNELENNMNTADGLVKTILEPTQWNVIDKNGITLRDGRTITSDLLKASNNEVLYVWTVQSDFTASVLDNFQYQNHTWRRGDSVIVPAGSLIYISSTVYLNKITPITFIWNDPSITFIDLHGQETHVITDDDGTILSAPNYSVNTLPDYSTSNLYVSDRYRGNILLSNITTKYLSDISTICAQYTREEYYHLVSTAGAIPVRGVAYFTRTGSVGSYVYTLWTGDVFEDGLNYYVLNTDSIASEGSTIVKYYAYSEYEYPSLTSITLLIANNTNFTSTNSWDLTKTSTAHYTDTGTGYEVNQLVIKFADSGAGECYNTGVEALKAVFKQGFVSGEKYWVACKLSGDPEHPEDIISSAAIVGTYVDAPSINWKQFFIEDANTPADPYPTVPELEGYHLIRLKCINSLSYNEMLKYKLRFMLYGNNTAYLDDCLLFKEMYNINNDGTRSLIVPNLSKVISDLIRTKYYFFRQDYREYMKDIAALEDIYFVTSCYEKDLTTCGFHGLIDESYEKVTNVTAKESNYFNLVQDVCERFECWAKFIIEHNLNGKTIYSYKLTTDTAPIAGKKYYKVISLIPSDTAFADSYYREVKEDLFYKLVSASAQYNRSTTYYLKLADGIYTNANLGYQYTGFESNYYYRVYTKGEAEFKSCVGLAYNNTLNYYLLSRGEYVSITVNDDFHDNPTKYYLLITSTPGVGEEVFDNTTTYERNYHKFVALKEYVGKDNYAGFKYGINLNNIVRNVKSDAICTKLYVADITEEIADNELCSIQDATANVSGETSIYNFQYYLNTGLISSESLYRDLYGDSSRVGIGFITKLNLWNLTTRNAIEKLTLLLVTQARISSSYTTYQNLISSALVTADKQILKIQSSVTDEHGNELTYDDAARLKLNTETQTSYTLAAIIARDEAYQIISNSTPILLNYENQLATCNKKCAAIALEISNNASRKMELITTFFKKYSQFIHEGTWNGEGYYDCEQYYSDAVKVAYTSAFPKVEYQLSAIELSKLEGYENYHFNVGDKTYIEDTEFFGKVWQTGRPYQEEVIVSEIEYCLDKSSDNKITILNYKTQFEDLFLRIAASTSSYEINKANYGLAAQLATNNLVSEYLINRILKENTAVITNAGAQTVKLDDSGLTITDAANPNLIMRAVGGGIILTTDGGTTWHTGITANGLNADTLKTGTIDTSMITIWDGKYSTFQWNPNGLMAYTSLKDPSSGHTIEIYPDKFVRFDENGIYGSSGYGNGALDSHPTLLDIQQYAVFSLTWDGFTLLTPNTANWVVISSKSQEAPIYDTYEFVQETATSLDPLKDYYILTDTTPPRYMRVSDTQRQESRTYYYRVKASITGKYSVISAGITKNNQRVTNFQLLNDGTVLASGGVFNGIVCATDIVDPEGRSMLVDGQWSSTYAGKAIAVFG